MERPEEGREEPHEDPDGFKDEARERSQAPEGRDEAPPEGKEAVEREAPSGELEELRREIATRYPTEGEPE